MMSDNSTSTAGGIVFDLGRDHSKRDLVGYGANVPNPQWPNNAKVCLSFVLNYEEGGEHLTGKDWENNFNQDEHAETFLTESGVAATVPGAARFGRSLGIESGFEYGSHRGFHRILDLFRRNQLRFTSWAIGRAVELNPQAVSLMEEAGCEVGSHSWRWIDYYDMPEEEERKHVKLAIEAIKKASPNGHIPRGWYTGRQSIHTRRIVYETYREMGALDQLYDSDSCKFFLSFLLLLLKSILLWPLLYAFFLTCLGLFAQMTRTFLTMSRLLRLAKTSHLHLYWWCHIHLTTMTW